MYASSGVASFFTISPKRSVMCPEHQTAAWFCDPWPSSFHLLGQEGFLRSFDMRIRAAHLELEVTPERSAARSARTSVWGVLPGRKSCRRTDFSDLRLALTCSLSRCPRLTCITDRNTLFLMARAVSVRLDDEVQRALNTLEASGMSRSEAIRRSILDAASALRRKEALRAEVASLEADDDDRQEMQAVASLMESLRATR